MATEVFIPKMTDHMEFGEIIQWLAQEGDSVEARQPILEIMTDKVAAEVEAPTAGVLKGIRPGLERGAKIPVGETVAYVAAPDEQVTPLPPLASSEEMPPAPANAASLPPSPVPEEPGKVRATPAARLAAKRLGVDISQVTGTGPSGRVSEEDVRTFASTRTASPQPQASPPSPSSPRVPSPAPAASGEEFEWMELSHVQRLTGERMVESSRTPQFTVETNVDATSLLAVREAFTASVVAKTGEKPSVTAFLVRAVAETLKRHPRLNASFEGGRLKVYRHINIGVAVGTDQGLMVPVVRDADQKSLAQVATDLKELGERARALRLTSPDVTGGTFTISNLGMYGVDRFTAIVNPPEAAILAVGRIAESVVGLSHGAFASRKVMNLTLTVDHRAVDGLQAARFLADLKKRIEEPY